MFDSTRLDMRLRLDPGELYRETTVDEARCAAPVARSSKTRQDDVSPPSPLLYGTVTPCVGLWPGPDPDPDALTCLAFVPSSESISHEKDREEAAAAEHPI